MNERFESPDQSFEANEDETKEPDIDALVVFGFGINSDTDLAQADRLNPDIPRTARQRLSIGAKIRTVAAAELYFDGKAGDVIFTGGPVQLAKGVKESEAELMEEYFLKILGKRKRAEIYQRVRNSGENIVDKEEEIDQEVQSYLETTKSHVNKEDKATNTIENFTNTINLLHKKRNEYKNVGLLSSQFHLDRIAKLARKHMVVGKPISAEEEVVARRPEYQKLVDNYFSTEGNNKFRQDIFDKYDSDDDIDDIEKKYPDYGDWSEGDRAIQTKRLGTSFEDYTNGEQRWSRGLDDVPEYWMQGLQFIEDEDQLRAILSAEQEVVKILEEKLGKDVDEATQDEIQNALSTIERVMPPAEWGEQGDILKKAKMLIYSDVDGTFMQPGYSEDIVKAGIAELGEEGVVILNSSWSTDGLLRLQAEYGISGPVIGENGGEIRIPKNFIDIQKVAAAVGGEYPVYEEGDSIFIKTGEDINPVIDRFNQHIRHLFPGKTELTGEIGVDTQMRVFGVSREVAETRAADQPEARKNAKFVLGMATEVDPTPEQLQVILEEANKLGIKITRARYLWHIMGAGYDKGLATNIATKVFRSENPNLQTVGIGDADNDIELLKACDRGYLVGDMNIADFPDTVTRTQSDGPNGWSEMVKIEKNRING